MSPETLKQLLQDYGVKANKTFGQNFLMDEIVLQDMVDEARVAAGETVIEVGPGIGNLTKFLLQRGAKVIAVEKDPQFVPILNSLKKQFPKFSYHLSDILKTDISREEGVAGNSYKVVANIPYYVTGKIIQHFLSVTHKPVSLTLLVQKEVGRNLTALPGKLNLLAISVQLYADVKFVEVVPARKFYPAPKVDSCVIHIQLHNKPRHQLSDEKFFFQVLHACFAGKRKQIHNTLTNNLRLEKLLVEKILREQNLSTVLRPQQLTIDEWINLVEAIQREIKNNP